MLTVKYYILTSNGNGISKLEVEGKLFIWDEFYFGIRKNKDSGYYEVTELKCGQLFNIVNETDLEETCKKIQEAFDTKIVHVLDYINKSKTHLIYFNLYPVNIF